MEQKKFRLRLNLFDGIVLALALAVGAFLLWTAMKPQIPDEVTPAATSSVRYTVRLQRCIPGTSELIRAGDQVADNIKNYVVGKVAAVEAVPCRRRVLDEEKLRRVWAETDAFEDILLTLESPCQITDSAIVLDGGYELRVGSTAYLRGIGYMGTGPVVSIEEVAK